MASPLYFTLLAGPVEAVPVPKPLVDAFVSATITESATEPSGFQLVFTLADDSILQTFFLLTANSPIPMLRVILMVESGCQPQVVMDGIVEHHEVVPNATRGSSKLVVSGRDLSALMDLVPCDGSPYAGSRPDERVTTILRKYAPFGIASEVVVGPTRDTPGVDERVCAHKGTDLYYVKKLAQDAGYVFYLTPGPQSGKSQAYWGPQNRFGIPQPALNVNMDSWTNVDDLTFRYQPQSSVTPIYFLPDSQSGQVIQMRALPVPFNPPLGLSVPKPQQTRFLHDAAKRPSAEAAMVAMAETVQNADVATGNGTLDVDRYGRILRARSLVGVRGAGSSFDGTHYVDSVTHNLKPGEYKQTFVLKRNALIADLPVVPALPY
jgi:hypothetical protein